MKISNQDLEGTGWIFSTEDGAAYIASNSHVLPTLDNPTVSVPGLGDYVAEVLGVDSNLDIAVIRVCCSEDFAHLELADAVTLRLGDDFTSLGYPLGVDSINISRDTLTGFSTDASTGRQEILTDASTDSGSSGGPMLDATGQVVGINTYRTNEAGEAIGFAISSETFTDALTDLKTHPVRTFESPGLIQAHASGYLDTTEGMTELISVPFSATSTNQAKNFFVRYNFSVLKTGYSNTFTDTSWGIAFRETAGARYVFVGIGENSLTPRWSSKIGSRWMLFLERDGERTLISEGPEWVLDFSLMVSETQGWLILGDPRAGQSTGTLRYLDLSDHVVPGEIHTIANYMDTDQQPSRIAYSVDAWRIAPVYRSVDQSVIQPAGEKASLPGGTVNGRFIALATFRNQSNQDDAINWSNGIELTQMGNFHRTVGITRDNSNLDYSVEIDTQCTYKLANVFLNPNVGASNQMIVGRTGAENRLDLIAVRDPNAINPGSTETKVESDSFTTCSYPGISGELSINPVVGLNEDAQVEDTVIQVPIFEIWALEKQ